MASSYTDLDKDIEALGKLIPNKRPVDKKFELKNDSPPKVNVDPPSDDRPDKVSKNDNLTVQQNEHRSKADKQEQNPTAPIVRMGGHPIPDTGGSPDKPQDTPVAVTLKPPPSASPATPTSQPSPIFKKKGLLLLALIGIIGVAAIAFLTLTSERRVMEAKHIAAVKEVVKRYATIKVRGTNYLDASAWNELLVDPILEKQRRSTCWLKKEKLRYIFKDQAFTFSTVKFHDKYNKATVVGWVSETRGLIRSDGSVYRKPRFSRYKAVYSLECINSIWFINCLNALEEGNSINCQVDLTGPDPCS